MNADELRDYARDLVADWPPLTGDQRTRLAALLHTPPVATTTRLSKRNTRSRKAA